MAVQEYQPLYDFTAVGCRSRAGLERRIIARTEQMRDDGSAWMKWPASGDGSGPSAAAAVGYRQLMPVVEGRLAEEEAWSQVRTETLRTGQATAHLRFGGIPGSTGYPGWTQSRTESAVARAALEL